MTFPRALEEAALARVTANQESRASLLQNALEARVALAEGEPEAVIRWIQGLGVPRDAAESISLGEKPAHYALSAKQVCQLKEIKPAGDLRHIAFVEMARLAANSVGRLVGNGGVSDGTFFMISPNLLITNHHVLGSATEATNRFAEFDHEFDINGNPKATKKFKLAPALFFCTVPDLDVDLTVVALGDPVSGGPNPSQRSYSALQTGGAPHTIDTFVNIIQHPFQERKQVVLRENRLLCIPGPLLYYMAHTSQGASGSPVFNDKWKVVGLHHWAKSGGTLPLPNGQTYPDNVNEGIAATRIVEVLTGLRDSLPACMQRLLDQALAL